MDACADALAGGHGRRGLRGGRLGLLGRGRLLGRRLGRWSRRSVLGLRDSQGGGPVSQPVGQDFGQISAWFQVLLACQRLTAGLGDRQLVDHVHLPEHVELKIEPCALDGFRAHLPGLNLALIVGLHDPIGLGSEGADHMSLGPEERVDETVVHRGGDLPAAPVASLALGGLSLSGKNLSRFS